MKIQYMQNQKAQQNTWFAISEFKRPVAGKRSSFYCARLLGFGILAGPAMSHLLAQQITVRGTVQDETGSALSGVSVAVKPAGFQRAPG